MIIDRYLIREISMPFVAITTGLVFIFASYSATVYLADAVSGQLPTNIVLKIIGLKVFIALEVLLPLGLYLGIIFGLGRLYGDEEMTALQAGGLSRLKMLQPLIRIALLMAILAGLLATFGRPWAYGQVYALETAAQAQIDITRLAPGRFQGTGDGSFVIYAGDNDKKSETLNNVFAALEQNDTRMVIRAERLSQSPSVDGPPILSFAQGSLYRLERNGGSDEILHFGSFDWIPQASQEVVGYKRKAASSLDLAQATDTDDIAERQWRFSRPLATLFLGLLGIAFARSSPRRGRTANAFAAAVTFALYYNFSGIARTWVEQGDMPPIPGVYWLDALVGVIALTLLFRPGLRFY